VAAVSKRTRVVVLVLCLLGIAVALQPHPDPPLTPEQVAAQAAAQKKAEEARATETARLAVEYLALRAKAAKIIRASGYDCQNADKAYMTGLHTTRVVCNGFYYKYQIEDRGGRLVVTPE
jgi:hypothetical protein